MGPGPPGFSPGSRIGTKTQQPPVAGTVSTTSPIRMQIVFSCVGPLWWPSESLTVAGSGGGPLGGGGAFGVAPVGGEGAFGMVQAQAGSTPFPRPAAVVPAFDFACGPGGASGAGGFLGSQLATQLPAASVGQAAGGCWWVGVPPACCSWSLGPRGGGAEVTGAPFCWVGSLLWWLPLPPQSHGGCQADGHRWFGSHRRQKW